MSKLLKLTILSLTIIALAVLIFAVCDTLTADHTSSKDSPSKAKTTTVKAEEKAEVLNEISDKAEFDQGVRNALDSYYTKNETAGVRAFSENIDSRADTIVSDYASAATERSKSESSLGYKTGQICVVTKKSVTKAQLKAIAEKYRGELVSVTELSDTENFAVLKLSLEYTTDKALSLIESNEKTIEYVQKDNLYKLTDEESCDTTALANLAFDNEANSSTAADNSLSKKAVIQTNDAYSSYQWYLDKICATQAWTTQASVKTSKVRVAVIDSGCDMNHPDLKSTVNRSLSIRIYNNGKSRKLTSLSSGDSVGHGTHVTGIIGATGNNGIGVTGVATGYTNSKLDIVAINVVYKGSVSDSAAIKAIAYARKKGCKVINCSWGSYAYNNKYSRAERTAIATAVKKNIVVVCAAGNGNKYGQGVTTKWTPGDSSSAIEVIATNRFDTKAAYSNYGKAKDISAPGGSNMNSTYYDIVSTWKGKTYKASAGTSMAAPVVTGIVAMMRSVNSKLTVKQVKSALYSTATDLGTSGKDSYYGYGLANGSRAVFRSFKPTLKAYYGTTSSNIIAGFSWNAISGTGNTYYKLYAKVGNGSWILQGTTTNTSIELYKIRDANGNTPVFLPGTKYSYFLKAYNNYSVENYAGSKTTYTQNSNVVTFTPAVSAPTEPKITRNTDGTGAQLNWTPVSTNNAGYQIQRYYNKTWTTLGADSHYTVASGTASYYDSPLLPGKTYQYRIRSVQLYNGTYYYSKYILFK